MACLGCVRRRQLLVLSVILSWIVVQRITILVWDALLSNGRASIFRPSLSAKYMLPLKTFGPFVWVVIPGRQFLYRDEKKRTFDQDLDNEKTDYYWKAGILVRSCSCCYCLLCRGGCLELAPKCHQFVRLLKNYSRAAVGRFSEVRLMFLCSSWLMCSWRKEYDFWWRKGLLRVFKYSCSLPLKVTCSRIGDGKIGKILQMFSGSFYVLRRRNIHVSTI